ncbi:hypothetical protein [Zoogloea sp.]|uniref:hypothetical protein n=1 Tax=Zoogloea sp. TaxID=49181 RepID=UPI0025F3ECBB|nr:hypothetical protein [Zoogloea sp.]MCK6392340.1 hypothetical protein [Zoogloea sp.]
MTPFLTDPDDPGRIRPPAPPAVFGLPVRTLGIATHWHSPATGALLAAEIGRQPRNLHTHLQRIALWASLGNSAALGAALVDFWIVLGPFGRDLRQRLLRQHGPALADGGLADYLGEHLDTGIDRHAPRAALPGVVLARPVEGSQCFLKTTTREGSTP